MASGAVAPDVPIQYFQSIIAIELVVAGAQLFQIRYFDKGAEPGSGSDPRLRLLMAIVLMSTVFASLEAMREGWGRGLLSS
jgi:hypothetical protein